MERIEAADFHDIVQVEDPRVSPAGEQVAFVRKVPDDDESYAATVSQKYTRTPVSWSSPTSAAYHSSCVRTVSASPRSAQTTNGAVRTPTTRPALTPVPAGSCASDISFQRPWDGSLASRQPDGRPVGDDFGPAVGDFRTLQADVDDGVSTHRPGVLDHPFEGLVAGVGQ